MFKLEDGFFKMALEGTEHFSSEWTTSGDIRERNWVLDEDRLNSEPCNMDVL